MPTSLINPGDVLEGRGSLLRHGRLIATVDYHLTIPSQTHFLINPTGKLHLDYEEHAGGFILLNPQDADTLSLAQYTLELSNKTKKTITIQRRYKEITHQGEPRVSFWVTLVAG